MPTRRVSTPWVGQRALEGATLSPRPTRCRPPARSDRASSFGRGQLPDGRWPRAPARSRAARATCRPRPRVPARLPRACAAWASGLRRRPGRRGRAPRSPDRRTRPPAGSPPTDTLGPSSVRSMVGSFSPTWKSEARARRRARAVGHRGGRRGAGDGAERGAGGEQHAAEHGEHEDDRRADGAEQRGERLADRGPDHARCVAEARRRRPRTTDRHGQVEEADGAGRGQAGTEADADPGGHGSSSSSPASSSAGSGGPGSGGRRRPAAPAARAPGPRRAGCPRRWPRPVRRARRRRGRRPGRRAARARSPPGRPGRPGAPRWPPPRCARHGRGRDPGPSRSALAGLRAERGSAWRAAVAGGWLPQWPQRYQEPHQPQWSHTRR